jgi:hypothetical protein
MRQLHRPLGWFSLVLLACSPVPPAAEDEPEDLGIADVEQASSELTSGRAYVLKAVHSGKCIDVAGASTADGATVEQWDCNGHTNQQFRLTSKATNVFEVSPVHSDKCLDVYKAGTTNGTKVQQWHCNDQSNQRWKLLSMGSGQYQLQAVSSSKCLEVAGASLVRGAQIDQSTCQGRSNQKFTLTEVVATSTPTTSTSGLTFRKANLTNFTSYPDPGSEECVAYNGCTWAGQFAFLDGKQSETWVREHNIAAIHSKDAAQYKLKTLRLRQGTHQIDVKVYDMCSDSDCNGCCTANSRETGFLLDLESATAQRFGSGDGIVDWACLDCK